MTEIKMCECGCRNPITKKKNRYIFNHHKPMLGKKHSEETKKRMSQNNKRCMLGKNLSEETKNKISLSLKGKRFSDEHRRKLGLSRKGKNHSIETRKRYSNMRKGNLNYWKCGHSPMFGKKLSRETKKKISERAKARKHQKHSQETKTKMSKIRYERWRQWKGDAKFMAQRSEKLRQSRQQQVLPKIDTAIEILLQQKLFELAIKFQTHKPILGQPDIFIEPNICIFADGCYWHGCEVCLNKNKMDNRQRYAKTKDLLITQKLINDGYIVFRFWEHEIENNLNSCISKIIKGVSL